MLARTLLITTVLALSLTLPSTATARTQVPFRGTWQGTTISAAPVSETVVFVVSAGTGRASHLGRFEMVSPHFSNLTTLAIDGTQTFTAANGDTLNATISGQLAPNTDGSLQGVLAGVITGGTGRFAGATGGYDFQIVARPAASGFGFDSSAAITGTISTVGSNKQ